MVKTYDPFGYPFQDTELYDMEKDPCQTTSIRDEAPETVAGCERLLDGWVAEQEAKPHYLGDPIDRVLEERGLSRSH